MFTLGQVKKKHVSYSNFYKKREWAGNFFVIYFFPMTCFIYTLLPSPGIRWSS